jgi:hypothetical protein
MPRYAITTFGCQMNVHDSRGSTRCCTRRGLEPTEDADAGGRHRGEHVQRAREGRAEAHERGGPLLAQGEAPRPDAGRGRGLRGAARGRALLRRMPAIDLVVGPDNIPELPGLLREEISLRRPAARAHRVRHGRAAFLHAKPREGLREVTAFVTIMKGCDERCTSASCPTPAARALPLGGQIVERSSAGGRRCARGDAARADGEQLQRSVGQPPARPRRGRERSRRERVRRAAPGHRRARSPSSGVCATRAPTRGT